MRTFRVILSLLSTFFFQYMNAQSNLTLIEETYAQLDSAEYLINLKDAINRSTYFYIDNLTEDHIDSLYNDIKIGINGYSVNFVLRVDIDTTKLHTDNYLSVEEGPYSFDLYCHDSKFNPRYFVYFDGNKIDVHGNIYRTFERKLAKKTRFAVKNVLKKKPQYILYCHNLPNTLLYVKDRQIYVYRVLQSKDYIIDDYIEKFKHSKYFYFRQ